LLSKIAVTYTEYELEKRVFLYLKKLFAEIGHLLVGHSLFQNPYPIGVELIIVFLLLRIVDRVYTQH
jgi:hypothetical protein